MKCPACGADMRTAVIGGVEIDICPQCSGIWFDEGELGKLADMDVKAFEGVSEVLKPPEEAPKGQVPGISERLCPRCGVRLFSHRYGGNSDIIIDSCDNCGGVFLDGGEFMKILRYLEEAKKPLTPEEMALVRNIIVGTEARFEQIKREATLGIFSRIARFFRRR